MGRGRSSVVPFFFAHGSGRVWKLLCQEELGYLGYRWLIWLALAIPSRNHCPMPPCAWAAPGKNSSAHQRFCPSYSSLFSTAVVAGSSLLLATHLSSKYNLVKPRPGCKRVHSYHSAHTSLLYAGGGTGYGRCPRPFPTCQNVFCNQEEWAQNLYFQA